MMTKTPNKVFIDSNMILYAASFKKDNVFNWINTLYEDIYIHIDVYNEILSSAKAIVDTFIDSKKWTLFDPSDTMVLNLAEQEIYKNRLSDVKIAFQELNDRRLKAGIPPKSVSNIGEMATITACTMINARVICSNDFDIRDVVTHEDYRVFIDGQDVPIIQDSAEDFCIACHQQEIAIRKNIRNFYKTTIVESKNRVDKLEQFTKRLDDVEN